MPSSGSVCVLIFTLLDILGDSGYQQMNIEKDDVVALLYYSLYIEICCMENIICD